MLYFLKSYLGRLNPCIMRLNSNSIKYTIPFKVLKPDKIHLLYIRKVIWILFYFTSRFSPLPIRPLLLMILLIVDIEGGLMFNG